MTPAQTQSWILNAVCERFGVTRKQLISRQRTKNIAAARHVAAYLLHTCGSLSFPDVAVTLRRAAHSSVVFSFHRVKESDDLLPIAVELGDEHDGITDAQAEAIGPRPELSRRSSAIIGILNADQQTRAEVIEYLRSALSVPDHLHRALAQQRADAANQPATVQGVRR